MGGGRRRFSKSGRAPGRALFVGGGLLDGWPDGSRSPASTSAFGRPKKKDGGGSASSSRQRGIRKKDSGSIDRSLEHHGRGNAFGYRYPVESSGLNGGNGASDGATPAVLGSFGEKSPVTVFVGSTPGADQAPEVPSYDYYSAGFAASHVGLGFHDEDDEEQGEGTEEEEEEGEVREMTDLASSSPSSKKGKKKNDGFLSIGGLRLYTEDISATDEDGSRDDNGEDDEEDDADSIEAGNQESIEVSSSDGDNEDSSEDYTNSEDDDDSEVDEEVMEDYLEGIGGASELLKAGWLAENFEEHVVDSSVSSESSDESADRLGGTALMNASQEYGMQILKTKNRKGDSNDRKMGLHIGDDKITTSDDLLFVKDCRTVSRKMNRNAPQLSRSWPCNAQTSKMDKNVRGGKKKHRKEMIARKRRERMLNRGVDLEQINLKLKQMVMDEADMFSFQPMHSRDCSQVQRLASIYRLRSGCQGSGKKRFVTVTRTGHTCLPSSNDKLRLEKLLGSGDEYDFVVNDEAAKLPSQRRSQTKISSQARTFGSYHRTRVQQSDPQRLMKKANSNENIREGGGNARRKQAGKRSSSLYANKPVSFVSHGVMQADSIESPAIDSKESYVTEQTDLGCSMVVCQEATVAECSSKLGAFELHTRGFGSRMMSKMGFMEGAGLGKDGQGIIVPIEATKRPKSLGLGVQFSVDAEEKSETGKDGEFSSGRQSSRAMSSSAGGGKGRGSTRGKRAESRGVGAFEKHTKGFGSKMMAKMGYVPGTGLGRDAQGITTPLTAVKLPKSLGLGSNA